VAQQEALIRARDHLRISLQRLARAFLGWENGIDQPAWFRALRERQICPLLDRESTNRDGRPVRNHAKFLAIDHRFMLVTSANFSWSAENGNIEFGVLIDNRNLAEAAEDGMRRAEDLLFELA
jgi:phosphatidylserine/phosphatidylglycerophosphate/cardiolipin synthase-like enzyme